MERVLAILEVSQKQSYIFSSRKLKDNILRSNEIERVTGDTYLSENSCHYTTAKNMVYSGGGHTVLQFEADTLEQARTEAAALISDVTRAVLEDYPEMELFAKRIDYHAEQTPAENLLHLTQALEEKKAVRKASFYTTRFGVESNAPRKTAEDFEDRERYPGWTMTADTDKMLQNSGDSFLAVVHIDGNAMGKRVQQIYEECTESWEVCREKLNLFSTVVDVCFKAAYNGMMNDLLSELHKMQWEGNYLPVRRIISAGDDICFVAVGKLGFDCAASFLAHLKEQDTQGFGKAFSACAGIVLVHKKYPFRRAYDLSEALCTNAKKYAAHFSDDMCAIDWHIEYGQLKDHLMQVREDYKTDDGNRLELRPIALINPAQPARSYAFFTGIIRSLQGQNAALARSKIKALRGAFKQGVIESQFEIIRQSAHSLLDCIPKEYDTNHSGFMMMTEEIKPGQTEKVFRNLFFDAIEISDRIMLWRK